jgi:hypothetical protein
MTPKEKAKELLERMNVIHRPKGNGLPVYMNKSQVKRCALIAVDEIFNTGLLEGTTTGVLKKYWTEVKQEIEKL